MTKMLTQDYNNLLNEKVKTFGLLFTDVLIPRPIQIFASKPSHFRMRAEFRIWHDGDDLYPIMFNRETREKIKITEFSIGSHLINQALSQLFPLIKNNPLLKNRLFQVDFLSTLSGQLLISLIYHKPLDEYWISAAKQLKKELKNTGLDVNVVGRAHKQKILFDSDFVTEQLSVNERIFYYKQVENSFTQPNAFINEKMLAWAVEQTKNSEGDLLELYCGNGNFSIALAQNFNQVLATEISKSSVESAQHNIKINKIDNLVIVRLSAEELTQAMQGVRQFNRLKSIDLSNYDCKTILVDPPRAGVDDKTLLMMSDFDKIIYISCNPVTLKQNLEQLTKTHAIFNVAVFDQFPYTEHIESGVVLIKR